MDSNFTIEDVLNAANDKEINELNKIRNTRLNQIDSYRGLMLKTELTFVAIAVPIYIGSSVQGWTRFAFGAAVISSLLAAACLVVLLLKGPRQNADNFDKLIKYIMRGRPGNVFVNTPEETWYEVLSGFLWPIAFYFSMFSVLAAIVIRFVT